MGAPKRTHAAHKPSVASMATAAPKRRHNTTDYSDIVRVRNEGIPWKRTRTTPTRKGTRTTPTSKRPGLLITTASRLALKRARTALASKRTASDLERIAPHSKTKSKNQVKKRVKHFHSLFKCTAKKRVRRTPLLEEVEVWV